MTEEDSYELEELLHELAEQFIDQPDRLSFVMESYRQVADFVESKL